MTRQERDSPAADLGDSDRRARRPERRVEGDLGRTVEELIEAGAPEDSNVGIHAVTYADFASPLDELPVDELPVDELPEPLEESDDDDDVELDVSFVPEVSVDFSWPPRLELLRLSVL